MYRTALLAVVVLGVIGAGSAGADPLEPEGCVPVVGRVVELGTGRPLAGVEVSMAGGDETLTDADGRFELCAGSAGPVVLRLRLGGEGQPEHEVEVRPGEGLTLSLDGTGRPRFSDELTVVAPADRSVEPAREVRPEMVVAMPGAGEDVLQTLGALPGVVSLDDWSSRLYVRGGRPDQNGIYIDGISVYDPYRLFGLTSLFNPDTLDSVVFYPGGFDVRYGDRLSAVVAVENRDGTLERPLAGSASVALTHTNLVGEGRLSSERTSSWLVSARRTYYDLVVKYTGESDSSFPAFTDAQVRLAWEPAAGHRFTVTLLGYDEGTDLAEDEEPSFGDVDDRIEVLDDQAGFIAGLRGEHRLGGRAHLEYVLSATRNEQASDVFYREGETTFESTYVQQLEGDVLSLRAWLDCAVGRHGLLTGVEAARSENRVTFRFRTQDPRIQIPPSLLDFGETQDFERTAAFVQDAWQLTSRLTLKAGVRWDRSTLAGMTSTSPRASLGYEPLPGLSLRAAWGHYTQFASYESLQGDGYMLDLRGISELGLEPERAEHLLVGASHTSGRGFTVALDLYHKELDDILQSEEYQEEILILDENDQVQPYVRDRSSYVPENARRGYARGAELTFTLLERSDRPFYGMASYAFGQAETRDDEGWLWEPWDRRHTVILIGGWRFAPRWELGLRWRWATGFPYTPLTNVIRVVEDVDGDGRFEPDQGDFITHQRDEPHEVVRSDRLPDYHRLDVRVRYSRAFEHVDADFYLDLINAYARDNVFGWDYNQDYTEREASTGMPFVPSIGVRVVF